MNCTCGGTTQIKEHGTQHGMVFVEACIRCFAAAPVEKNLFFDLIILAPGKVPSKANTRPLTGDDVLRWTAPLKRMIRDQTPSFAGCSYEVKPVTFLRAGGVA